MVTTNIFITTCMFPKYKDLIQAMGNIWYKRNILAQSLK